MTTRIGINGFGRIGRLAFRHFTQMDGLEVAAINDIAPLDNLAYLLRHDSAQPDPEVSVEAREGALIWDGREIPFYQVKDPGDLPWDENGVDIGIEATGIFRRREDAARHLEAGATRVIITAPSKSADVTICMGVNEERFDPEQHVVLSNASCTTNCLAVVARVLHDEFGIVTGFLTTVHAVTSSQSTVDAAYRKWTRGRNALINIVPTTTGAAVATTLVLPELEGRLDGLAMRVPVAAGSIIDFVFEAEKPLSVESINDAFRQAAATERLQGILGVSEEPLVSSDVVGTNYSALAEVGSTMVLGGNTGKVLAWYDNEWGYARRVADLARYVS